MREAFCVWYGLLEHGKAALQHVIISLGVLYFFSPFHTRLPPSSHDGMTLSPTSCANTAKTNSLTTSHSSNRFNGLVNERCHWLGAFEHVSRIPEQEDSRMTRTWHVLLTPIACARRRVAKGITCSYHVHCGGSLKSHRSEPLQQGAGAEPSLKCMSAGF